MTKEQKAFLEILSDNIFERKTSADKIEGIDIRELFNIACEHKMTELVYSHNRDCFKNNPKYKAIFDTYEKLYGITMYKISNRDSVCNSVLKSFENANITFFVFKGMEIAKYYKSPVFRTFSDVDVMMSTEDRDKAHEIMLMANFVCKSKGEHEWCYYKGKVLFELHDSMLFKETFNPPDCIEFCSHCWEYTNDTNKSGRKELDLSFHFIYLLLHLRKHMLFHGVGFRQFYDLAVLAEYKRQEINWEWIENSLSDMCLLQFGEMCLSMCQKWFNVESPLKSIKINDEFYLDATERIFANGVFGEQNSDNDISGITNKINSIKAPRPIAYFIQTWTNIFPSYKDMKSVPYYNMLDGKPVLLPAFWMYRLGRIIFKKNTQKYKKLTTPIKEKDKIIKRNSHMNTWGL